MKALMALLVVLAALPGCASVNEPRWFLNGRTQQQFHADQHLCADYAALGISDENMSSAGRMMGSKQGGLGAAMVLLEGVSHEARYGECMARIGYTPAPSR